jgi:ribosomal protein S18 acetylase RimI-like enzyme
MPVPGLEVVRCPAELRAEALALVLCELAPSQRREVARCLLVEGDEATLAAEPLFVARRGDEVRGAAWGQRQAGNIAVFWPPQLVTGEDERAAIPLAEAVVRDLDDTATDLAQSLLPEPDKASINVLKHVGFRHIADLLYLTCESARFPLAAPEPCELEFEEYTPTQRDRLRLLIERTYEGTLDCTALNGVRDMDEVINGYQATGVFRPANWLYVRSAAEDIGILLLADHREARHWELMYMGLVPEVRGRGWGRQIARYAQWLARGARVDRLLVAVDAANTPAVNVYRNTGFEIWERRAVYLRFARKPQN